MDLRSAIRTIPDYPKPGIMFRDVSTLMGDAAAFRSAVTQLADPWRTADIGFVAGIEARGFIFGAPVALELGAGFIPLRKPGKLPYASISEPYALEYGHDELHMHADAIPEGSRVLLLDDLIATGGTAMAGVKLIRRGGGDLAGCGFIVDLPELGGAAKLRAEGLAVEALLSFDGH